MKPHEETWESKGRGRVYRAYGKKVAQVVATNTRYEATAEALIAAAPEMARALAALLLYHDVITTRAEAEAVTAALDALRKAGVPCP